MDRMACVSIPALPLQLLLIHHPDWRPHPVVVVDEDKPQGLIQWANRHALRCRIQPGMRYASGLSLSHELRAGCVSEKDLHAAKRELMRHLFCFSPNIEPSPSEPGCFWLDLSGLLHLYPSPAAWANAVHADILRHGFHAIIVVGFSRFGTYAAAKSSRRHRVFLDPADEQAYLRRIPIDTIGLAPRQQSQLIKLGVRTLGAFMNLPPESIRHRLDAEAARIHHLACGAHELPLTPDPMREPPTRTLFFDFPETHLARQGPQFTQLLHAICRELSQQGELLASLHLLLVLEDHPRKEERITPATPTLDVQQLASLLNLRLASLRIESGVTEARLQGIGAPAMHRQIDLFDNTPNRDVVAMHQALARLRARFGNDIVMVAQLCDAHLPEAGYQWQSAYHIPAPAPAPNRSDMISPLVRRIYTRPIPLPRRHRHHPKDWLPGGAPDGWVEEVIGPYRLSSTWWDHEQTRSYYYLRTQSQRWLWTYYDEPTSRWFLQGDVE